MRQGFSPKLRKRILERDGYRCQVCHAAEDLQIDHCLPVCLGGNNNPLNLRVLCGKCNVARNRDIKRYRTKRVKQHVRDMELQQEKKQDDLKIYIKKLEKELVEKEWLLDRNEKHHEWLWEQLEFLQERVELAYGADGILKMQYNTITLMQLQLEDQRKRL